MPPLFSRSLSALTLALASCSNAVEPEHGPSAGNRSTWAPVGGQAGAAGSSAGEAPQTGGAVTAGGDTTALTEAGSGGASSGSGGALGNGATSSAGAMVGGAALGEGGNVSGGAGALGGAGGGAGACAALFCEDFESGHLDPAVWTIKANQGQTMQVQGEQVAHGK